MVFCFFKLFPIGCIGLSLMSPLQENTFQGVLVTDGSVSYAVFIYNCDQMDWGGGATIGYHADGDFYKNHALTGSESANEIACTNSPDSPWSNVVYRLTVSGTSNQFAIHPIVITRAIGFQLNASRT